ncbi:hypothetical protein [Salibacterium aidingense]|uniref:hypothetical protein n=1 Tax=Salibacterium aidingense TaxID=384933 RepID=UPI00041B9AE2|nr:hypothetical protein [Salibacterium aidingense]
MADKNLSKGIGFFIIFLLLITGAWMANGYVEQKRVEKFYSYPENTEPLSFSNENIERDTFAPREYVKIKSLSS